MVQLEFLIKCKFIDKIIKSFRRVTTTEHESRSQGHPSEPRSLESHVGQSTAFDSAECFHDLTVAGPAFVLLRPPLFVYLFILAILWHAGS